MTYPLAKLAAFPFHHRKRDCVGRPTRRSFLGTTLTPLSVAPLSMRRGC